MPEMGLATGTVTFLFTDVEGSTRLWERHPEQMRAALAEHDALIEFLAERHSYDEPEIVATPIVAGSPSFLSWLTDETRSSDADPDVPRPREADAPAPSDISG